MLTAIKSVVFSLFICFLFGCSTKQAYYSLQQDMRHECQKIMDNHKYKTCMEEANVRYEEYEKARKDL